MRFNRESVLLQQQAFSNCLRFDIFKACLIQLSCNRNLSTVIYDYLYKKNFLNVSPLTEYPVICRRPIASYNIYIYSIGNMVNIQHVLAVVILYEVKSFHT